MLYIHVQCKPRLPGGFFHAQVEVWWASLEVPILFTAFALYEGTGAAEGYMESHEQIWSNNLIDRFEERGATSVDVMIFQNNDGNLSAASAFHRVIKVSSSPGFKLISTGEIKPKVCAKARAVQEKERIQAGTTEFDWKTQAATKQSLATISEAMVTKEDFQSLGESSQKRFDDQGEHGQEVHFNR